MATRMPLLLPVSTAHLPCVFLRVSRSWVSTSFSPYYFLANRCISREESEPPFASHLPRFLRTFLLYQPFDSQYLVDLPTTLTCLSCSLLKPEQALFAKFGHHRDLNHLCVWLDTNDVPTLKKEECLPLLPDSITSFVIKRPRLRVLV